MFCFERNCVMMIFAEKYSWSPDNDNDNDNDNNDDNDEESKYFISSSINEKNSPFDIHFKNINTEGSIL